jgi:hypothetical protein
MRGHCTACVVSSAREGSAPVSTSETIAASSEANQRRIVDACPHASAVRTFHGWLATGRVVTMGQKGIRLVAPDTIDDSSTVRNITPVSVFDVTQTQELHARAATKRSAGRRRS